MKYYHILIEYVSFNKTESYYVVDIKDIDKINREYIEPLILQKRFFIKGHIIQPQNIKRFLILESERKISEIVFDKNNEIPKDILLSYTEEDLLKEPTEELKDVTFETVMKRASLLKINC